MSKALPESELRRLAERSPTAWFVMLETARKKGDAEAERHALQKLHALGVTVVYHDGPKRGDSGQ